ncbi:MAG: hypothetical protein A2015_07460 [Spirochaetes bacterium GWF1_31_7]|nr:MAG: hypothetical protein A2Y30_02840 [Spirochaetes bacterium GWE1_32_154]OHD47594.1 MAG: hypothetical protein A2Y29_00285 [Spirochaetes bacterium GWE2_31_10]OHD51254.1 MAG: hypothetical protein A2015_07460 [Spirochaetes bacterium GWF1_31_7]OHD81616.1 MAG: hypothetical protein A2355_11055 [Spirochaetes bacterium RIFOXYB1_FULL_32_8]HBD96151.1 hypothetical protein [Spirochaetia bacterium]
MIEKENKYLVPFFAAISAFLSVSESLIPTPVPFIKLGISNIPICIGITLFSTKDILFITIFKVLISSIVRGTIFSFPFVVSLAGNSIFLLLTIPFYKLFRTKISLISISIIGAFSHNIGQLLAALLFIPIQTIQLIAIILLPIGLVTGVITGILSNSIYNNHLEKFIEIIRNKK